MKNSPFIYGSTVNNEAFTNRKTEIAKLTLNLTGGINTCLISPRRWGKSSLVEKVSASISKSNTKTRVVIIDLFTVSSEEQFLEKFAREVIKSTSSKWQEWTKNARQFFKTILPKMSVGIDPINDFSISFDWKEVSKNYDEILNLPESIASQKGIQMVVCIDEFQSIANFSNFESFEKKLRAIWQRQQSVTYCIYGSQRHMMSDIFNNPSKPFYRFGDIMLLQKIERSEWVNFIGKNFTKTGKSISKEDAGIIADLMQCHSWYVQQLAHYSWNLTTTQATKSIIQKALTELINANTPFYQKEIEILSTTQVNLLRAIAAGEKKLTSVSSMSQFKLGTPRNVSKNKTLLINNDVIQQTEEGYEFVDPAFELWFRQSFLNEDFSKKFSKNL